MNGGSHVIVLTQVHRAIGNLALGNVERAAALADEASEAALLAAQNVNLAWAMYVHGWVALERGDLQLALEDLTSSIGISALMPRTHNCTFAPLVLAEPYLAVGTPGRARDALIPHLANLHVTESTWALRLLVEAELALNRHDAARRWLGQAEAAAERLRIGTVDAHANWARAAVALADSRARDASQLALAAAGQLEQRGRRLDGLKARILAARAQFASGERDAAREQLAGLHACARACGAVRVAAATEPRGRQRPTNSTMPLQDGGETARLSRREQEVVALVAKGCTNRQIADQLVLSVRTVETHVSRILDKLGVRSRSAILPSLRSATHSTPAQIRK